MSSKADWPKHAKVTSYSGQFEKNMFMLKFLANIRASLDVFSCLFHMNLLIGNSCITELHHNQMQDILDCRSTFCVLFQQGLILTNLVVFGKIRQTKYSPKFLKQIICQIKYPPNSIKSFQDRNFIRNQHFLKT